MKSLGILCLATSLFFNAREATANALEETFSGCSRAATQDTLGNMSWDPFSAAGNPAWAQNASSVAFTSGVYSPIAMPTSVEGKSSSILMVIEGQKAFESSVVGALTTLPVGPGALLDTGNGLGQQPLWSARARSLIFEPYLAHHFEGGLSLGLGVPVLFNIDSAVELHRSEQEYYTRVRAGMRPSISYILGLAYRISNFSLALAFRDRHVARTEATVKGDLPLPVVDGISFYDRAESLYAFSPRRIVLQGAYELGDGLIAGALLRYSFWSEMPSPFLNVTDSSPLFSTVVPSLATSNTLEMSAGLSYRFSDWLTAYASYRFQPSPLEANAAGYYDRDTHVLGVGVGISPGSLLLDQIYLSTRVHALQGRGLYTWFGMGVGSTL